MVRTNHHEDSKATKDEETATRLSVPDKLDRTASEPSPRSFVSSESSVPGFAQIATDAVWICIQLSSCDSYLRMQTVTEIALEQAQRGIFTREQAALWVGNRGARLDALLKRAVSSREVWRLRRGLYCLPDRFGRGRMNPLEVAQRIHGPSYVSLETALSHHGWIPEGVQAITSVALDRSRTFNTPVGVFSFTPVPQRNFLAGVRRITADGGGAFFMAIPLKALADLIYVQRFDWRCAAPVVESLRVDEESLVQLTGEEFDEVMSAYRPGRASRFLAGLRKELGL